MAGCCSTDTRTTARKEIAKSKLDFLTNTLHAIAIMFDLEVHEDLPSGEPSAICERIEQVVNGRCLKAFSRGLSAGKAGAGADPDELPESHEERTA